MNYLERRGSKEYAYPVTIGEDCWIGGGAVICPGVTIGNRCVIGAGSVVTKDIPDDSVAVGNPARLIRKQAWPGILFPGFECSRIVGFILFCLVDRLGEGKVAWKKLFSLFADNQLVFIFDKKFLEK